MNLVKFCPEIKRKPKVCKYKDCGKAFMGTSVQKYCDYHTDPRHRIRIRFRGEGAAIKNQVWRHGFVRETPVEFTCAVEGCYRHFSFGAMPGIYVYPKFCEDHRSEYRRNYFARRSTIMKG